MSFSLAVLRAETPFRFGANGITLAVLYLSLAETC